VYGQAMNEWTDGKSWIEFEMMLVLDDDLGGMQATPLGVAVPAAVSSYVGKVINNPGVICAKMYIFYVFANLAITALKLLLT
jgi:hypothetical protein